MSITAIIPAVVEPDINKTILSLLTQSIAPDKIIVAVNNTDSKVTEQSAASVSDHRVQILNLGYISGRKAGALNASLDYVETEFVLIMDADTVMGPGFLEVAIQQLQDERFGAVGGIFHGIKPTGYLQWCQFLEYERFASEVERTRRVMVLTGTGSLIRMSALNAVKQARSEKVLTGKSFYDTTAITEDMELTLAIKSLGYKIASPKECSTTTELMGNIKDLQKQRIRWYRGALDNLKMYGYTTTTRRYWFQQAMLLFSTLSFFLYIAVTTLDVSLGWLSFSFIWLGLGAVFLVERVATVWGTGWKGRVIAFFMLPELVYSAMLQVAFLRGILAHIRNNTPEWHQAAGVR